MPRRFLPLDRAFVDVVRAGVPDACRRPAELCGHADRILGDPRVVHVDLRLARNDCFQTRAVRA